jgi:aryl-alcohol dehydrogenase-like predicted oxidoreductase
MNDSISRRAFLGAAAATAAATGFTAEAQTPAAAREPEWRNRQPGMSYRRLGRTGYMVSEVVMGGNTIAPDNWEHVELAIDMGLNYLDTSPAYGNGRSELGYANVVKGSSKRSRVFLNSKVSVFDSNRNAYYRKIYDNLSEDDRTKIDREMQEIIDRRRIMDSRYFGVYFRGQVREMRNSYLSNVMEKYYGDKIDRRAEYYDRIIASAEESLKRLGTDYLDLFMCPHGASKPEETQIPEMFEAMEKLRRDGKVRFFGLSAHTDSAGVLSAAVESGMYDAVMIAYNIVNGDFTDAAVRNAYEYDVGVIAMKAARAVYPDRKPPVYVPKSRIERLNRVVPAGCPYRRKRISGRFRTPTSHA